MYDPLRSPPRPTPPTKVVEPPKPYDPMRRRDPGPVVTPAAPPVKRMRTIEEQMNPQPPTLAELAPPAHGERFEVVLLDRKKSVGDCLPGDFKREVIVAASPHEARVNERILKLSDTWTVVGVVTGGVQTMEEQHAHRRALVASTNVDRARVLPPTQYPVTQSRPTKL